VIARLQAFYGGDPGRWLQLPMRLLRSYLEHLPGLQAERNMQLATVVAVGTGSLKKHEAEGYMRDWRRAAGGRRNVIKPASEEERAQLMQEAGITVG
jgi:hypothetical protein